MIPLFSLTQITLVDRKILVSEWICINNSVVTLLDKWPKTCLQLILIVHKKYLESSNVRDFVTVKLNEGTFIHLIPELSQVICLHWQSEQSFNLSSPTNIRSRWVFPSLFNLNIYTVNCTRETEGIFWEKAALNPLVSRWCAIWV